MAIFKVTINPLTNASERVEAEDYNISGDFAQFFDVEGNVVASFKTNSFASIVKQ